MNRQTLELMVNGETVHAQVEPRQQLGDFVRRELGLTGTHLSCEHGVCGACTLLVDGQPQRACITLAVACQGAAVTTIEGYGDDPVMAALRRAFHQHHALQCGYCTPGMLCTARDIVLRLPGPDARRVRHELAGNLCRCTGYVGIVEAIDSVLTLKATGSLAMPAPQATQALPLLPWPAAGMATPASARAEAHPAPPAVPATLAAPAMAAWPSTPSMPATPVDLAPIDFAEDGEWVEVAQTLDLPLSAEAAWPHLTDLSRVAGCLPGARVARHRGDDAEGTMQVAFGPIRADFALRAHLVREPGAQRARLKAEGTDQRSATRVKVLLDYGVQPLAPSASRLALHLRFRLAGPLAQFSRSGLVADYVAELTRLYGLNLQGSLAPSGSPPAGGPASGATTQADMPTPMRAPSLWRLLMQRIRRWLMGST